MAKVNYKNIKINFTSNGKGSAIVFLHGFLENISMWKPITFSFTKNHKIICIDLLGHGKTGNLGYIHTMEEQARMIKTVLDHLKLREYTLIGHSMGGYVCLAFAELFPNNVKGICLMNSTALPDTEEKKKNRDRGINAVKYNAKTFVKLAIPNLFSEENRPRFLDEIKNITNEALQISQEGIIASLEGMKIRKDRTYILRSETFTILMIISKKDPVLEYKSLLDQVKDTKVKIAKLSGGHMSHIENKKELINTIKIFIN
jgi:pimeloyl-ACP methyl ester carboxylesterase